MTAPIAETDYPVEARARDRWILALRPDRAPVDVRRPHALLIESERSADGGVIEVITLFLTGRECPWRCLMCDLWKNTTSERTPVGAIPAQLDFALRELAGTDRLRDARQIKLYNSGSFFDRAAVPFEDYEPIARRVASFERVIVESHPALIGDATRRFRALLEATDGIGARPRRQGLECGCSLPLSERGPESASPHQLQVAHAKRKAPKLEVAMGLETAHPDVLEKLNKRVTLEQFAEAAAFLKREGIALRVFVLIKPPFMNEAQGLEWAVRSTQFAFDCGAEVVSLIPTRFGNGALEALAAQGQFAPPHLATVEAALEQAIALGRGRVFVDVWDLEKFSNCPACFPSRHERLTAMNRSQSVAAPISCGRCR